MFFRCAKGSVYDVFLHESEQTYLLISGNLYLVKLKTETRLPTGESNEFPSGVKTKLPRP